ncbi:MAG: hypothetical protein WKF97_26405, partial [Chitinophagaceae bacterium]
RGNRFVALEHALFYAPGRGLPIQQVIKINFAWHDIFTVARWAFGEDDHIYTNVWPHRGGESFAKQNRGG